MGIPITTRIRAYTDNKTSKYAPALNTATSISENGLLAVSNAGEVGPFGDAGIGLHFVGVATRGYDIFTVAPTPNDKLIVVRNELEILLEFNGAINSGNLKKGVIATNQFLAQAGGDAGQIDFIGTLVEIEDSTHGWVRMTLGNIT